MKIVGASTWVVRFLTVAICAVGAALACTSASNGPAIGGDAQPDKMPTGTPEAGADAGRDMKDGGADAACVPSVGVATVDAGALFGCYQTACASELRGCAADCVCDAAIASGLQCLLDDAGSAQTCFYAPILRNAVNVPVRTAGTCLQLLLMDGDCERRFGGQAEGGSGGESGAPADD